MSDGVAVGVIGSGIMGAGIAEVAARNGCDVLVRELNVGDLKPSELDMEFFLNLAWNPHAWNGTNTYQLLEKRLARDFDPKFLPELTFLLSRYYVL
ncbi:MAG TPA: glycosyl hydrolase 115 family protein, partial [Mycobacteriales bacterium]|nr:glycosyl hydrolase 115 family protein [Mycobacteriales bacterium]